jgi:hypothetical protein
MDLIESPGFGGLRKKGKTDVLQQLAYHPNAGAIIHPLNALIQKDWFQEMSLGDQQRTLKLVAFVAQYQDGNRLIIYNTMGVLLEETSIFSIRWDGDLSLAAANPEAGEVILPRSRVPKDNSALSTNKESRALLGDVVEMVNHLVNNDYQSMTVYFLMNKLWARIVRFKALYGHEPSRNEIRADWQRIKEGYSYMLPNGHFGIDKFNNNLEIVDNILAESTGNDANRIEKFFPILEEFFLDINIRHRNWINSPNRPGGNTDIDAIRGLGLTRDQRRIWFEIQRKLDDLSAERLDQTLQSSEFSDLGLKTRTAVLNQFKNYTDARAFYTIGSLVRKGWFQKMPLEDQQRNLKVLTFVTQYKGGDDTILGNTLETLLGEKSPYGLKWTTPKNRGHVMADLSNGTIILDRSLVPADDDVLNKAETSDALLGALVRGVNHLLNGDTPSKTVGHLKEKLAAWSVEYQAKHNQEPTNSVTIKRWVEMQARYPNVFPNKKVKLMDREFFEEAFSEVTSELEKYPGSDPAQLGKMFTDKRNWSNRPPW